MRDDLYEQCSFHIAEKMPSSVKVGVRPMSFLMRSYSSGLRPWAATSAGVTRGVLTGLCGLAGMSNGAFVLPFRRDPRAAERPYAHVNFIGPGIWFATLIDAYETKHYPMNPPDPIEAIKFRMEQQGLTRRDLEEIIGTRTRIAEILNRTSRKRAA